MAQSNAAQLVNLRARRDAILTELAALSSSTAGGLPNVSGPGVNADHQGYRLSLYAELKELRVEIARLETVTAGAITISRG